MRPIFNNHQHVVTRVTGSFTALKKKKKNLEVFSVLFHSHYLYWKASNPHIKRKRGLKMYVTNRSFKIKIRKGV